MLEFSSRFAMEVNKMFSSLLRFEEIQDTLTQFRRFQGKEVLGSSDLPESVMSALLKQLQKQPKFRYTAKALADGFQILLNPATQFEHRDRYIILHTILTLPYIANKSSFCTVESLSPVTYKPTNKKCYSGPITRENLILVTCPNSKIVLNSDSLTKCFGQHGTLVCPDTITRRSHDSSWLGMSWLPGMSFRYPRTHSKADCDDDHPVIHLGGRYYLSTKRQKIKTNTGTLNFSPLSIYHIPCNVTSDDLPTGFSTCPKVLSVNVPIFRRKYFKYVPWDTKDNNSTLKLHYKSLNIPPPLKINKTIMYALDKTFNRLNGDLAYKLRKIRKDIDAIHSVQVTPKALIIALVALVLAGINTIIFILLCCCQHRRNSNPLLVHYSKKRSQEPIPVFLEEDKPEVKIDTPSCSGKCPDCNQGQ